MILGHGVLYDKIIGIEEYTESEQDGINPSTNKVINKRAREEETES